MVFVCPVAGLRRVTVSTWCHCAHSRLPDLLFLFQEISPWSLDHNHALYLWLVTNIRAVWCLKAGTSAVFNWRNKFIHKHAFVMSVSRWVTIMNHCPDFNVWNIAASIQKASMRLILEGISAKSKQAPLHLKRLIYQRRFRFLFSNNAISPCVPLSLRVRVFIFVSVFSPVTVSFTWQSHIHWDCIFNLEFLHYNMTCVTSINHRKTW